MRPFIFNRQDHYKEFTGERLLLVNGSLLSQFHLRRYQFAADYVKNKVVLDLSCGAGYGSFYLASYAKHVTGIDIDGLTITHCQKTYKKENLFFQIGDGQVYDNSLKNKFDVITSFETIEHLNDYRQFLINAKKYLKPQGIIILSTPNNFLKTFPPRNKFHVREFDILELEGIIKNKFPGRQVDLYGQGKTNVRRMSPTPINNTARNVVETIWSKLYDLDLKYLKLLQHIEHLALYKCLGDLQRGYRISSNIYPINVSDNFYNPTISIFVIGRMDK